MSLIRGIHMGEARRLRMNRSTVKAYTAGSFNRANFSNKLPPPELLQNWALQMIRGPGKRATAAAHLEFKLNDWPSARQSKKPPMNCFLLKTCEKVKCGEAAKQTGILSELFVCPFFSLALHFSVSNLSARRDSENLALLSRGLG